MLRLQHLFLITVIACLALLMQGCGGCDKDTAQKCITDHGGGDCEKLSSCFKDKSCCDFEMGQKMKTLTKGNCDREKLAGKPHSDACN
mmetsp:Transcript_139069/g.277280  ORF Transcript_139069/g.277280 Transcript_139069/m.277280 type:complete len:88 (-) Transcript_139069:273-536(-)